MVTKIYLVTNEVFANAKQAMNYSALFIFTLTHNDDVRFRGTKQNGKMFMYLIITFNNENELNEFNEKVANVTGVYDVNDIVSNATKVVNNG